jgi:hypothetical protein
VLLISSFQPSLRLFCEAHHVATLPTEAESAKLVAAAEVEGDSPRRAGLLSAIAGMFVAIFEREFSDAGFVELAEAFGDHAVVLFLGGACER